jgi:hypothetical protein
MEMNCKSNSNGKLILYQAKVKTHGFGFRKKGHEWGNILNRI